MLFEYKNRAGQPKSMDLPIKQKEFNRIKNRVNNSELDDLGYWEFWLLRDYIFKALILNNFKKEVISFFEKLHLHKFQSSHKEAQNEVKVVDVFYHFYDGQSVYLFSEPSLALYPAFNAKRVEISLKYTTDEMEYLLEQILTAFGVDYANAESVGSLSSDELEFRTFFSDLMLESWSNVKVKLKSNLIGMLSYATGGSGCMDLDNGNDITDTEEGIRSYLNKRGLDIIK